MQLLVVTVAVLAAAFVTKLLLVCLQLIRQTRRMARISADIKGPPTQPLLGNIWEFIGPVEQLFQRVFDIGCRYNGIFRLWLGPYLVVCVTEPEDLQVVFTSPHVNDKPYLFYHPLHDAIGKGLVVLNGSDYKRHRKAVTGSMHLDILQEFLPAFNTNCRELVDILGALADTGEVFDVAPLVGRCASLTVVHTVLSSESRVAEADSLIASVHLGSRYMLYRCLRPWYANDFIFRLLDNDKYHTIKSNIQEVVDTAGRVLSRKITTMGKPAPPTRSVRQTFLDKFLNSPEAFTLSQDELLGELQTLMLGGTGTSMDFLAFFFVIMSLVPEEQRKVHDELDDVFGAHLSRDVTFSDLPHLFYLDRALKETLRVFSVIPFFARLVTKDVTLPSGCVLPEGCNVLLMPMLVHRNPRHFPDPSVFNPDRFSPENSNNRHPYSYIPFSAGSRNCIGQRYAFMFAKTLVASVLRHFDVLPDPTGPTQLQDLPLIGGLTMSIKGGARIRLRRRQLDGGAVMPTKCVES